MFKIKFERSVIKNGQCFLSLSFPCCFAAFLLFLCPPIQPGLFHFLLSALGLQYGLWLFLFPFGALGMSYTLTKLYIMVLLGYHHHIKLIHQKKKSQSLLLCMAIMEQKRQALPDALKYDGWAM